MEIVIVLIGIIICLIPCLGMLILKIFLDRALEGK